MALLLNQMKVPFLYEDKSQRMEYVIPESKHKYNPDWNVAGMILETKGLWDKQDRDKILLILDQYPGIDLRMVFENPKLPIYKGSKTSYAAWCDKNNIKWGTMADVPTWILNKIKDGKT